LLDTLEKKITPTTTYTDAGVKFFYVTQKQSDSFDEFVRKATDIIDKMKLPTDIEDLRDWLCQLILVRGAYSKEVVIEIKKEDPENLTLERVVQIGNSIEDRELSNQAQGQMSNAKVDPIAIQQFKAEPTTVHYVKSGGKGGQAKSSKGSKGPKGAKGPSQGNNQQYTGKPSTSSSSKCKWCGYKGNHKKDECPAKDEVCRNCTSQG